MDRDAVGTVLSYLPSIPRAVVSTSSRMRQIVEIDTANEDTIFGLKVLNLNPNAVQFDENQRAIVLGRNEFEGTRCCSIEETLDALDYIKWWILKKDFFGPSGLQCSPLQLSVYSLSDGLGDLPTFLFDILRVLHVNWTRIRAVHSLTQCICLRELSFKNCNGMSSETFFEPFSAMPSLTMLTVVECDITSLKGLNRCSCLTLLDISSSRSVATATGLEGSPALEVFLAHNSEIRDLKSLNDCPRLWRVNVSKCFRLLSLDGLTGSPSLTELVAYGSSLRSLKGISSCPRLKYIDITSCIDIESTSPLRGTPSLETLLADECTFSTLDGLSGCPCLNKISLRKTPYLKNMVGLSPSDSITTLSGERGDLTSLKGLEECAQLVSLNVSSCAYLSDLSALQNCNIRQLIAERCDVKTIGSLMGCSCLEVLNLNYSKRLCSLSGLCYLPVLKQLHLRDCGITSIDFIGGMPQLEVVDISLCAVSDLSVLCGCKKLKTLDAHDTPILSLEPVLECRALESINVSNCEGIKDIALLRELPNLKYIAAVRCGIPAEERKTQTKQLQHVIRINM